MIKKIVIFAIGTLLLASCQNQAQESVKTNHQKSSVLHLNKGEKWVANKETHLGMNNLKELLIAIPDSANYADLVTKMGHETQYIIKNCNMTGEDHDQLHLVLHPILENISKIENGENTEAKAKGVANIQKSLQDYFSYFKTN